MLRDMLRRLYSGTRPREFFFVSIATMMLPMRNYGEGHSRCRVKIKDGLSMTIPQTSPAPLRQRARVLRALRTRQGMPSVPMISKDHDTGLKLCCRNAVVVDRKDVQWCGNDGRADRDYTHSDVGQVCQCCEASNLD